MIWPRTLLAFLLMRYLGRMESFKPVGTFLGAFDNIGRGAEREYRFILASERPDVRVERARGG